VLVLSPPSLWYMKDTNGDGVADIREEWVTGFHTDNVQALANGLEWHLDHGVYFAGGRTGAELKQGGKDLFTVGRRDLRLDAAQKTLTPVSGGEQFGHAIDDWGNRYVCNNSNHLEQVLIPLKYLDRNPQVSSSNVVRTIAAEGAASPVFRKSPPEPWRIVRTARRAADPKYKNSLPATELVATGFFTSATGVTIYRGGVYPPEFQGNAFIGDVGGNLVHRKALRPNGIAMLGERQEQGVEFLASTDNWFRPANFVNAPDGTLYILDMYWETIEHPASIPEDIKEHLDLESGNDRGRVYRLVSPNMQRFTPPKMSGLTAVQLVEQFKSPHGWVRDTAHRLLWERQDAAAVPALKALVRTVDVKPVAVVHALWSLQGLQALTADDVLTGLNHTDSHVREHAIAISEGLTEQRDAVLAKLVTMTEDADLRVKWQLAFSLGEFTGPSVVKALGQLAKQADKDADLRLAILTSVGKTLTEFGVTLLSDESTMNSSLAREVARMVGSTSNEETSKLLLQALASSSTPEHVSAVAMAVGEGTIRRGVGLVKLVETLPADSEARKLIEASIQTAVNVAKQNDASVRARIRAATLLGYSSQAIATDTLSTLLSPQAPPELQQTAVKTLLSLAHKPAQDQVLAQWKGLGPAARKDAIDGLTQSRIGAASLLAGLVAGTVKTGEIDRDKQQFLINYPQAEIRDQARKLLGGAASNRREVVTKYQPALELTGDPVRGQAVHQKICMQCHRAGTTGHAVGPDLVSVQNKSPDDLLIAILDPNREAQPIFVSYTASTEDGKVYTGIIAAETAASVTLRRAEAKEDVVLRNQLEELVSNGVSLMPEGMEKDLTPQQVADVIAFIKSLSPPTAGK
jgi:putative membrane-bound dehydrogenase-like protein